MSKLKRFSGAVDIGGTKIAVGLVDEGGRVVSRRSFPTRSVVGWREGVNSIGLFLKQCQEESGVAIDSLGVGCTGPVDPIAGTVGEVALLPGWKGCNLVDALAATNFLDVALENDADAAALAEYTWGSGRGAERFLYVTVSTGIGTGFIVDGKLYRGARGCHPEMGHHSIDSNGPLCYCGARGCLESLASGSAIARRFTEDHREKRSSLETIDARAVFELAHLGDEGARCTINRFIKYLAAGLTNMTNLLVPDVIALGGGVMKSMLPYLATVQDSVRSSTREVSDGKTLVCMAELQDDVGLAGAAAVGFVQRSRRETSSSPAGF